MNDVEFPDGAVKKYADNVIAMNILSQFKSYGCNSKTLCGIVDYKQDYSTVSKAGTLVTTNRGVIKCRQKNSMEVPHPMKVWHNKLDSPQNPEGVQLS